MVFNSTLGSLHLLPVLIHSCRRLAFIICCVSTHFSGTWNFLARLFHWGLWYSGKKCFSIPGMLRSIMILAITQDKAKERLSWQ